MDYFVICLVSLAAAGVTLFSGFGLGTVLTPAFALFFPVPVAIAASAIVHLANNVWKLALVGRHAHWPTVLRFGVPAALLALAGAWVLGLLSALKPLATYHFGNRMHEVTWVKITVAVLIMVFGLAEMLPKVNKLSFDRKYLPLGGALSGFFGGLSGNQGALRSAFLIKSGLSKEAFIGTGVVCAVIVDTMRVPVYLGQFWRGNLFDEEEGVLGLVAAATLAAFVGSYLGARLVSKVTLRTVQMMVGLALVIIALAMAAGVV